MSAWAAVALATRIRIAMTELNLSARAYDRILKVSRTVADLVQSDSITAHRWRSFDSSIHRTLPMWTDHVSTRRAALALRLGGGRGIHQILYLETLTAYT